jgi:nucleoside phosphorylase
MQLLFSGKDRFNAESQETKSMLMSIGPNIRGTLDSIGDKALTFALFSSQLKSHSPSESYFLRRTISELYTKHYLDWLKGDILTGIPKYGYFDYMSNSFPLNDYYLSRILLEVLFPNLYSPSADDDVFMLLAQSRKTIQHVQFSKTIRNILTALWFLNTAQSNKLGMTLIRDCICKDLNLMKLQSPLKYAHIEIDAGQEYYGRAIDLLSETCLVFDSIKTGFKDALKLANNIEEGKMNRILICLATDLENRVFWEISKSNGFSPQTAYSGELAYQIIGTRKGCELLALRSEAGSGGTAGSQLSTLDAVDALKPNFVISLGVAFGSDQTIQAMGDVLVSQQIRCYELQRVGPTNIIPRGDLMPCDPSLLARFEAAKLTWSKCKIHTGLILSGDKLVDSPEFKKQLLSMAPEAIGGEMEGAGIVSSCYRRRTPWILAKGICDWAESKGDKHQEIAAQNTMNLFYDILESGGWSTVAN